MFDEEGDSVDSALELDFVVASDFPPEGTFLVKGMPGKRRLTRPTFDLSFFSLTSAGE